MTYGIKVFGKDASGEFLQIDSDLNLVNYVVTHIGVGSTVSVSNISALSMLVFVRGQNDGNIICFSQSGSTISFIRPDGTPAGSPISVEYAIAADVTGVPSTGGGYGIRVFTSTSQVAFDSTRFLQNYNFYIPEYVTPNSIDGSDSVVTTNPNLYTEIGRWSYFNSSDPFDANYAGAEYTASSVRHWDLEVDEEIGTVYWDNYSTILLADIY
jgi:hypothetical protein